jgi:hypothetical protein
MVIGWLALIISGILSQHPLDGGIENDPVDMERTARG